MSFAANIKNLRRATLCLALLAVVLLLHSKNTAVKCSLDIQVDVTPRVSLTMEGGTASEEVENQHTTSQERDDQLSTASQEIQQPTESQEQREKRLISGAGLPYLQPYNLWNGDEVGMSTALTYNAGLGSFCLPQSLHEGLLTTR